MQLGLFLALNATQHGGQPALGDVVIAGGDVVYSWSSIDDDTVTLIVTSPADYAGSFDISLTDLATAPQLIRVAPEPTGTQALGETLTGRPALWAIAAGETIEIERRWWKGNGPLLDQAGQPPLNLLYECEWHSDAQEPFRIDERARYVAEPEASWSDWQDGDETTPPDPSPFLSGSFVEPATRELWYCSPYTTHHVLLQGDNTTPAVRSLDAVRRFETINPNAAILPRFERIADANDLAEIQVRSNALMFNAGRAINLDLSTPAMDWNNRSEFTAIIAVLFQQIPTTDMVLFYAPQSFSANEIRLRPTAGTGRLRCFAIVNGAASQAEDADWFDNYLPAASVENPRLVVIGMRRKDDTTTLWTNGTQVATSGTDNVGQTFNATSPSVAMSGVISGSGNASTFNAPISGAFFSLYGLSDAEMNAVMGHIGTAMGGTT